jgi:ketosteroid isomerase-like protein
MMRSACLCTFLLLTAAMPASAEEDVLAPIHRFFDAFAKRDKAGMLAEIAEGAEIISERDGQLRRLTLDALTDRIVAYEKDKSIAETIHDPITLRDGTLAVVWTGYSLAVDGKADRCGTDSFTLLKLQDRWRIVAIADNSRDQCGG